mmetsp:Transcript_10068/g.17848  ORF Transcript_10068/g.17848 Transcript_10068/m.17848 type:complete len:98 (+) Transcript_10068:1964-2257(+)
MHSGKYKGFPWLEKVSTRWLSMSPVLSGRHATSDDLTLVKEVEKEERPAWLELDTDLHQLYLFEPNKAQGLVVSNTKKREHTQKLRPTPPHGKNRSQ